MSHADKPSLCAACDRKFYALADRPHFTIAKFCRHTGTLMIGRTDAVGEVCSYDISGPIGEVEAAQMLRAVARAIDSTAPHGLAH